jgi:hypothetical protein
MGHAHQAAISREMAESQQYQQIMADHPHEPANVDSKNLWRHELQLAHHSLEATGLLPQNHFWQYAEYRWDLAVNSGMGGNFAHYHGALMKDLELDLTHSLLAQSLAGADNLGLGLTLPGVSGSRTTPYDPQVTSVPEPSTGVMAAITIISIFVGMVIFRWAFNRADGNMSISHTRCDHDKSSEK